MEWLVLAALVVLVGLFARFTVVEEGTAKAVKRFGEFLYIIFQWQDHWMDEQWTILRTEETSEFAPAEKPGWGPPWRIFGGLYLYGFWPIHTIHRYTHRWTDIHLGKEGEVVLKFHEEEFSHVLLRPAVYAIRLTDLETSPPERIPVTILILVTLRVSNPYRFLFVAPPTPTEDVLARMGAEMRPILTGQFLDALLLLRGEALWAEEAERTLLRGVKLIEETLEKWGIKVADKGVEIRDIDLPLEYQKAAALKREQELRAAGRAEEIRGTLISAVARSDGRPESDVQAEFARDPGAFLQRHGLTRDDVMTKLSMEARAYLKIETPGAGEGLGDLLRAIGAWQRMPPGGGAEPRAREPRQNPEPFGRGRAAEVFRRPPE